MEEKDVLTFKRDCREYLSTLGHSDLRVYGRSIGVYNPTKVLKDELIERIIAVFCGEIEPTSTTRGAPVKNKHLDPSIPETIEDLRFTYSEEEIAERVPDRIVELDEEERRLLNVFLDKLLQKYE